MSISLAKSAATWLYAPKCSVLRRVVQPHFEKISGLDFQEREGEDALAEAVERVLAKIQAKYDELGIADQPFVIVKADAGTYGIYLLGQ
jgi:serine protease inhibitor